MVREIPLTRGLVALVDDEDFERISQCHWYALRPDTTGIVYAAKRHKRGETQTKLHRFILQAKPGEIVDHANRNGLDCRRINLRKCTRSLNQANRRRQPSASGFKGVHRAKKMVRWAAQIQVNNQTIRCSGFETAEDAARAYDELAREHFGEFARLNFPNEGEQAA